MCVYVGEVCVYVGEVCVYVGEVWCMCLYVR